MSFLSAVLDIQADICNFSFMNRLINRYILKEIALAFAMIVFILTFVLLMGKILQLMDLMINKGISFTTIAQMTLFLMPSFLIFSIPISLLIAILIGLGRLSGDNEITILKMSGVSLYQIAFPVACAALAASLLTAATTFFLVPYGNIATRNLLFDMAKQKATIGIREKVFIDDFRGILLYAEKIPVHGDFLEGVLISDNRILREPNTIFARRAYLISDIDTQAVTLRLEDGSTHTVDAGLKNYRKMDFRLYDIRLDLAESLTTDLKTGEKSSMDMTVTELTAKLRSHGINDQTYREMLLVLNKKLTVPLSCLIFAFIGVPFGIRAHRAVRSRGFAIGVLLILIYYLLSLSGEALAETGRLSPAIGAWAPNGIFAIAGILFFYFAAREQSPWVRRNPVSTYVSLPDEIGKKLKSPS
ncbi:MAG: LPS export ABC transporter permease LptF [Syntrophus sp. GWC2_56_31]|nr:MAG: LPS export ABC transporter permease LptF [Syntrophus sp. GWC2_56_31]